MIRLIQAAENTVVLTLSEKVSLTAPVFLFVLTEEESNLQFSFIASDSSVYPERYNQFLITEKESPDLLNGEVSLPRAGHYRYAVHEQTSSTNLDPSLAETLLETGICLVLGENETITAFETENDTNIIYHD